MIGRGVSRGAKQIKINPDQWKHWKPYKSNILGISSIANLLKPMFWDHLKLKFM